MTKKRSRIDAIGQNGNDGDHYDLIPQFTPADIVGVFIVAFGLGTLLGFILTALAYCGRCLQ